MENHIETNFREIQKILDSCIAHDYKTKVDALFLKREYLTQAQLKDYLYNPQNHPSTFSKRSVSILRFFSKTKRLF